MHRFLLGVAALAIAFCANALSAQAAANPQLSSDDTTKTDTHDRPVGGVKMKLPAPAVAPPTQPTPPPPPPAPTPVPPPEDDDIPPTETPPAPPPPEDPPTYYDEPVQGKFAFLLDASGSMYGSRVASVRQETVAVIQQLTEDDEFDCNAYGGQHPSPWYTVFLWGSLQPATDGNKSAAIAWVNGPATNPGGMTPTYACLQRSCQVYPADLDKMFLLTDGYPNITGDASAILGAFPGWWSKFSDCTLVCICIGGVASAQTFMQQLAALAGGTYIQR
ncbi:MAG TPA: hypothetical protein PLF37_06900 [Planctomycetota bacterium]|nr:hypothetical protein [Planctomycetota bacterium]